MPVFPLHPSAPASFAPSPPRRVGRRGLLAAVLALIAGALAAIAVTALGRHPRRLRTGRAARDLDAERAAGGASTPTAGVGTGPPLALIAYSHREGFISLRVFGPAGTSVQITQAPPSGASAATVAAITLGAGPTTLTDAVRWQCADLRPTFTASATLPDGSTQTAVASFSTPSCANRLTAVVVPTRLHEGYPVAIELTDAWRLGGLRAIACLRGAGPTVCRGVTLRPGAGAVTTCCSRPTAPGRAS